MQPMTTNSLFPNSCDLWLNVNNSSVNYSWVTLLCVNFSNSHKLINYCFRKFVYELHINSAADNKQILVCIEIPFRTVVGLNISPSPTVDVIIEVDTVPAMWQGKEVLQQRRDGTTSSRIQYNTLHTVDLTDGQLSKIPYHKVSQEYTVTLQYIDLAKPSSTWPFHQSSPVILLQQW